mmetsp:Transcript_20061/g.55715  ORF Transcript_20061/g.55715 Transcript_20061/m.55715 type:complete len:200 (-) Transcript_20061:508-1107(-)
MYESSRRDTARVETLTTPMQNAVARIRVGDNPLSASSIITGGPHMPVRPPSNPDATPATTAAPYFLQGCGESSFMCSFTPSASSDKLSPFTVSLQRSCCSTLTRRISSSDGVPFPIDGGRAYSVIRSESDMLCSSMAAGLPTSLTIFMIRFSSVSVMEMSALGMSTLSSTGRAGKLDMRNWVSPSSTSAARLGLEPRHE